MDIKSIKISPDPPQKGQDLNVTVSGTVKQLVEARSLRSSLWRDLIETYILLQEGAYALVQVKIGRIKILQKEIDICEEAYAPLLSLLRLLVSHFVPPPHI